MKQSSSRPNIPLNIGLIATVVIISVVVIAGLSFGSNFFYLLARVDAQQVGIKFESGQIIDVVGPGVYSDFGLYVEMKTVNSQAVSFDVSDAEIITEDKQRIGLRVTGDAFRPDATRFDVLQQKWAQYSQVFLNDDVALQRLQALAQQAMKVCVGERKFDDAIIGTARDELRSCIDEELSKLAENYGLQIENVVVPEVILSPDVQAKLDLIVQSRLDTEKAAQDKLKAEAEAAAEQARQEGEIKVAQARIQEETRQQTILAQLEEEKLIAEQAVIQAQKANDLLAAQQDLEINQALAVAAAEKAKADLAEELALADLYSKNPAYLQLLIAQTNASALKATDKIIFTPEGVVPTIVLPGPGITPTVETTTPQ
ncbi:MAG TPA: SPFH domain-containing protein [Anaerolineales bacterium]|nr:SPFH domain-containing protein [Anaerolineales bacterium]